MSYLLRGFIRMLLRLCVVALGVALLFLGWRALLHYGPGMKDGEKAPAMFGFHAKALVKQRLAFPWPVEDSSLPVPAPMSSAEVQLRLMKWWDGKQWLPLALVHGESSKGALRLHAGELTFVDVASVSAPEKKADATLCVVRFRVRWEVPEDLQELVRVKEIVGLRLPRNLIPGQSEEWTCTFVQRGWSWEPILAESKRGGRMAGLDRVPKHRLLDWIW